MKPEGQMPKTSAFGMRTESGRTIPSKQTVRGMINAVCHKESITIPMMAKSPPTIARAGILSLKMKYAIIVVNTG